MGDALRGEKPGRPISGFLRDSGHVAQALRVSVAVSAARARRGYRSGLGGAGRFC